jgi:hypothetical protein
MYKEDSFEDKIIGACAWFGVVILIAVALIL